MTGAGTGAGGVEDPVQRVHPRGLKRVEIAHADSLLATRQPLLLACLLVCLLARLFDGGRCCASVALA